MKALLTTIATAGNLGALIGAYLADQPTPATLPIVVALSALNLAVIAIHTAQKVA